MDVTQGSSSHSSHLFRRCIGEMDGGDSEIPNGGGEGEEKRPLLAMRR